MAHCESLSTETEQKEDAHTKIHVCHGSQSLCFRMQKFLVKEGVKRADLG